MVTTVVNRWVPHNARSSFWSAALISSFPQRLCEVLKVQLLKTQFFLECCAVSTGKQLPMIRSNTGLPSFRGKLLGRELWTCRRTVISLSGKAGSPRDLVGLCSQRNSVQTPLLQDISSVLSRAAAQATLCNNSLSKFISPHPAMLTNWFNVNRSVAWTSSWRFWASFWTRGSPTRGPLKYVKRSAATFVNQAYTVKITQ